ncbi:MAG: type I-B CRISPR-associated protein Cas7/Cst2/DevR [Petrotogales bacterium]
MGRYIVMDVVFYGNSLNYDQGSGNYQELKKITKWDGRQYSLVSRYSLRYSLLETAKQSGLWSTAEASKLQRAGDAEKTVIQPAIETLLTGEILEYPEFDLFGYLITNTTPSNPRTAPVKISHAVSLTPFQYDSHLSGNLGLARRMVSKTGKMDPNLFTMEEHQTYYIYNVVVDLDRIGKNEVYLSKKDGNNWEVGIKDNSDSEYTIDIKKADKNAKGTYEVNKEKKIGEKSELRVEKSELDDVYILSQEIEDDDFVNERLKQLVSFVMGLKRSIKGREEDLSPKLMVVGVYKNKPYKTYKDKINLVDEYVQEEYDEIEESEEDGKKIYKVRHKTSQSRKPIFEVEGTNVIPQQINENEINELLNKLFDNNQELEELKVFKDTSVQVRVQNQ